MGDGKGKEAGWGEREGKRAYPGARPGRASLPEEKLRPLVGGESGRWTEARGMGGGLKALGGRLEAWLGPSERNFSNYNTLIIPSVY